MAHVQFTGKLLLQVLKVLVAVLVHADHGSGLGITCTSSAHPSSPRIYCSERTDVLYVRATRSVRSSSKGEGASVPPSGGHNPMEWWLAVRHQCILWSTLTLIPIRRKLRSVLMSVDMAALSVLLWLLRSDVAACVAMIDAKHRGRLPLFALASCHPCLGSWESLKTSGVQTRAAAAS
jgi:hypothetical protein